MGYILSFTDPWLSSNAPLSPSAAERSCRGTETFPAIPSIVCVSHEFQHLIMGSSTGSRDYAMYDAPAPPWAAVTARIALTLLGFGVVVMIMLERADFSFLCDRARMLASSG